MQIFHTTVTSEDVCKLRGHKGTDTFENEGIPEACLPLLMVLLRSREFMFLPGTFPDLAPEVTLALGGAETI